MKKAILFLSTIMMATTGCQQAYEKKTVDVKAEEVAVSELLNKIMSSFKEQDVPALDSLLTEDLLCLGSDPSEAWNKKELTEMWKQMLAEPFELDMNGEPMIKVSPDGRSAFAVQQYFMPSFSSTLALRNGYHLIKTGDKWMIFAINTSCIPKNEDLPKIDSVLSK